MHSGYVRKCRVSFMQITVIISQKSSDFFPFFPFFHPLSLTLSYLCESKNSLFSIRAVPKKHERAFLPSTLVLYISLSYKKIVIYLALRKLNYYYYNIASDQNRTESDQSQVPSILSDFLSLAYLVAGT